MSNLFEVAMLGINWVSSNPLKNTTDYYVNDRMSYAMQNAWKVKEARDYFYNKYQGALDLTGASVTNYKGNFGLEGLARAGIDPVEQFIGSYNVNIWMDKNDLVFFLKYTTSFKSLAYGLGPSWEGGPMGNNTQFYMFTEPIDYSRLR